MEENGETKVQDFALGTMTSSYPMGSTVKGATVLTGYQTKAIQRVPTNWMNQSY